MSTATPPEAELPALNRQIDDLEAETELLREQQSKRAGTARRARFRHRYLRLARWFRSPAASLEYWPLGALTIGPLIAGLLTAILIGFVASSAPILLVAFAVGVAAAGGAITALLYWPRDERVPAAVSEAEADSRLASAHWQEAAGRLADVKDRLQRLLEERRARMVSGRVQRAALLQRRWKAMNAAEWEDFVVEVCRTLGATVDRRGHFEGGGELIIIAGERRVAALASVSREPIHSGAVQQALAMKQREGCESCAILSNGRFTGAAQDFAARNHCALIGRDHFPDFVMGKIEL
jgi:hypothetical protein